MRISGWSSDVCSSDLVFLHMGTVRLYGHAGSDVQGAYLPKALIEADEARDPLLAGAALMAGHGWMTAAEIAEAYEEIGATDGAAPRIAPLVDVRAAGDQRRSEEHTSELQSLMRISYAVFCL